MKKTFLLELVPARYCLATHASFDATLTVAASNRAGFKETPHKKQNTSNPPSTHDGKTSVMRWKARKWRVRRTSETNFEFSTYSCANHKRETSNEQKNP
jgi:hypothetical protein